MIEKVAIEVTVAKWMEWFFVFKDMVSGIEKKLFEGDQSGKCPKYSMLDLDNANFRYTIVIIFFCQV